MKLEVIYEETNRRESALMGELKAKEDQIQALMLENRRLNDHWHAHQMGQISTAGFEEMEP